MKPELPEDVRPVVTFDWYGNSGRSPKRYEYNRLSIYAGVAELADAQDLKSWVPQGACGFDSHPRHHILRRFAIVRIAITEFAFLLY